MMASNVISRPPAAHANRGRWFEQAIEDSIRLYHLRGLGKIMKHRATARTIKGRDDETRVVRTSGPVDYSGGFRGIPFAMDAKTCAKPRLRMKMIPRHQFDELLDWQSAPRSAGFLLVCFEERWVFALTPSWLTRKLNGRESVRLDECAAAVATKEAGIVDVAFRTSWVPVDFGPAVMRLAGRRGAWTSGRDCSRRSGPGRCSSWSPGG